MPRYRLKRIVDIACLAGLLFFWQAGPEVTEAQGQQDNIVFRWAFVAQTGPADNPDVFPITKDTVLQSGDRFKMMVENESDCHIYLLYYANNEMSQLYPAKNEKGAGSSGSPGPDVHYIPDGDNWFALDDQTGIEKLYLMSGATPLVELEKLLENYENAPPSRQAAIIEQIKTYIKGARRKHRQLVTAAERPLQIGGTFRGAGNETTAVQDIRNYAIEVRGKDFFARTFTIEHQ